MKKIIFIVLSVMILASMILVSCGKATPTPTPPPTTSKPPTTTVPPTTSKPPTTTVPPTTIQPTTTAEAIPMKPAGGINGGRLEMAMGAAVLNMSDIKQGAGPVDAMYVGPCIEPLLRMDGNQNLHPWLAERFEVAPDFSSITLYLRHGVKFHDGTDFNADAVVYAVDCALANPQYTIGKKFKEPVVIDPYTVRLDFVDGKWDWDSAKGLSYWWGLEMFSPTAAKTHDEDWLKTHVVGTGPFIMTNYALNQKVSYDKNPNYWRGVPYLDGIDYNIIPDPTTQLLAYKAGEIHILGAALKDVASLKAAGFNIVASQDMIFNYCLVPSSANPNSPLADVRVRQACQYAIDQDALIEGITYGLGKPSQQLFPIAPYTNPDVVGYPFNIQKAKDLLAAAGYGNGLNLTLYYASGFGDPNVPPAVKDMFAKVGITLKLTEISYIQSAQMIFGAGWDGFLLSFQFPGVTIDPGFTAGMDITQGGWVSLYKPPDIAAEINGAAAEPDNAKRTATYMKVSKELTDICEWQFLYWTGSYTSTNPTLKGDTVGKYIDTFPYAFAYFQQ